MASLIIQRTGQPDRERELGELALTIGREPDCELVIDDRSVSRHHACIEPVDVQPGAPSPVRQLEDNVTRLLSLARTRPEVLRMVLREAVGLDAELDAKLDAFHGRLFDLTEGSLRLGMSMGLVRPCQPHVVARCLVGAVKEVVLSRLLTGDLDAEDRRGLARELLSFAAQGILTVD